MLILKKLEPDSGGILNAKQLKKRLYFSTKRLYLHPQKRSILFTFLQGLLKKRPWWRNWQTRWIQNPVIARSCGFDSHPRYNKPKKWLIASELQKGSSLSFWSEAKRLLFLVFKRSLKGTLLQAMNPTKNKSTLYLSLQNSLSFWSEAKRLLFLVFTVYLPLAGVA